MRFIRTVALATAVFLSAAPVSADEWTSAIASVKAEVQAYHDYLYATEGSISAGVMYAPYGFAEHRCVILGRMLGQPELIRNLETFEHPPRDETVDAYDLQLFAASLSHWIDAAEWAVDADASERINTWNLDCAGRYGIPLSAMMASERPEADFDYEADSQRLLVYGDIDVGFADRFQAALQSHPEAREVVLGSGGGSVRDALVAGTLIRQRGLDTSIFGNCYSACPLVFVGGVNRVLWANSARLGFHQVYVDQGEALPLEDPVYRMLYVYLGEMGADPEIVISWMWSAPPGDMFEPEPRDMCPSRIATFIQRIC